MRSALLSVNGVTRAKVTLDPPEAFVTYDPEIVKVEDLISAVAKVEGGPSTYSAAVKKSKR